MPFIKLLLIWVKPSVYYYNVIEQFSDENGNLSNAYYGDNGIHLKRKATLFGENTLKKSMNN